MNDEKRDYFNNLAEQIDKLSCPSFVLWYALQWFDEIADRQMAKGTCTNETICRIAEIKMGELRKAAKEIRDIVSDDLW